MMNLSYRFCKSTSLLSLMALFLKFDNFFSIAGRHGLIQPSSSRGQPVEDQTSIRHTLLPDLNKSPPESPTAVSEDRVLTVNHRAVDKSLASSELLDKRKIAEKEKRKAIDRLRWAKMTEEERKKRIKRGVDRRRVRKQEMVRARYLNFIMMIL